MDLVIQETLEEILISNVSSLAFFLLLFRQITLLDIQEDIDSHSRDKPEDSSQDSDQQPGQYLKPSNSRILIIGKDR